jgi:hypothetical protein
MLSLQTASAAGPTVTRYKLDLWGTSDFQGLAINNTWLADYHVDALAGGSISRGHDGVTLNGPGSVSTTTSMLFEVANVDSFTISLAKASNGEAHARMYRTNGVSPVLIASMDNYMGPGSTTTVYKTVTRSSFVADGLPIPRVDPRRLVLAFYYPWFKAGSFNQGPWYDKPVGPYRTEDATEVSAMVSQAAGAGVDGFIVSWDDVGDHTQRFDLVLSAAAGRAFYVAPVIELLAFQTPSGTFDLTAIRSTISLALQRSSNPNFLSVAGRPVVFVFGVYHVGAPAWRQVVDQLNATGMAPFFVGESPGTDYGFDGNYMYNPNGHSSDWLRNTYMGRARASRYPAQVDPAARQQLWAASVSPGMNLSYFNPLFPQNEARRNGQRFADTWIASLPSSPEWVLVTSWNEWYEATHIQPSEEFGTKALDINRSWAAYFHNPTTGSGSSGGGGGLLDVPIPLHTRLP